ncbi:AbrB/MazE/SpoVT family DNA-binding domain-containing protein [Rickettsia endosymbiont of Polydrusus tereticollis]|uniref:AbrB/MazE/SpoVT family DNA-binding domain-containing protein n=1 Tax=Rickettsia endosymbiont of Polydrusus tereticollis TaxID=3066251 RepID=UPI0031330615
MKALHTHLDKNGRILIPHQIRNSLKYKPGDSFIINTVNDELRIISIKKAIKEAQNLLKQYNHNLGSLVDEFLEQKYQEAKKENSKF